jgi:phosphoenolpyruvate carboxylase
MQKLYQGKNRSPVIIAHPKTIKRETKYTISNTIQPITKARNKSDRNPSKNRNEMRGLITSEPLNT